MNLKDEGGFLYMTFLYTSSDIVCVLMGGDLGGHQSVWGSVHAKTHDVSCLLIFLDLFYLDVVSVSYFPDCDDVR